MVEEFYRVIVYLNGQYIPLGEAAISPVDRGFLFGDGVYEVVRSYGGRLFRMESHLARLAGGLRAIQIDFPNLQELQSVANRLLAENSLTDRDASVYLQITRGPASRTLPFPSPPPVPTVYGMATPVDPVLSRKAEGISVVTVPDLRWARCDIKAITLLPNVLARQEAASAGADDAILVRDGMALEGTSGNLFGVFDGQVVTSPRTHFILHGVTRDVVLEICRDQDLPVREAPITEEELGRANELFLTSTVAEILPVVRLDGRPVGEGSPGAVTHQIREAFRALVMKFVNQRAND